MRRSSGVTVSLSNSNRGYGVNILTPGTPPPTPVLDKMSQNPQFNLRIISCHQQPASSGKKPYESAD